MDEILGHYEYCNGNGWGEAGNPHAGYGFGFGDGSGFSAFGGEGWGGGMGVEGVGKGESDRWIELAEGYYEAPFSIDSIFSGYGFGTAYGMGRKDGDGHG